MICDLAEYYHITDDYRNYEVFYVAALVAGLPEHSRTIKMLTGQQYGTTDRLLALIVDIMQSYIWVKGGKRGAQPQSLFREMTAVQSDSFGFDSVEEFEAARRAILEEE